jgi:prepilin-type N-terminal cleavage/methylation domain-containing protein
MTRSRKAGFSLIEVLFAIFLAATCAAIVAGLMPLANSSRKKADDRSVALSLGQKMAEAIVHLGYANATPAQLFTFGLLDSQTPSAANTYTFTNIDSGIVDSPSQVLRQGTGSIVITEPSAELRQIVIIITWSDPKNGEQQVRLVHQVANL